MKKMKLYAVISPLCILFAQSALTAQAQKIDDSQLRLAGGKILIDSVLTQKKSDSLKVAFRLHLDSLQLKPAAIPQIFLVFFSIKFHSEIFPIKKTYSLL